MTKCPYLNKDYDSITEACVAAWMLEAYELGVIRQYYEQQRYDISDAKKYEVEKRLKTKVKRVEKTLLQAAHYTADFVVFADSDKTARILEGAGLMPAGVGGYCNIYSHCSDHVYVIDVKGECGRHSSGAKFSLTQKFLHETRGIYVNKLVPCARQAKAKARSFFMMCGVPRELPVDCFLKDGGDFRQPWRDMFSGCPTIAEVFR